MFSVIFEVQPKKDRFNDYLEIAKYLKPRLEAIEGFIENERFKSLRTEGRLLSLSTWRDEKSLVRWRTQSEHHGAQEKGRFEIFEDYHLRVGEVIYDSDPPRGLAGQETRCEETEAGKAKVATITELVPRKEAHLGSKPEALAVHLGVDLNDEGLVALEGFESIYSPGKFLLLGSWLDARAAQAWRQARPETVQALRHRHVRVIRDYGMFDRREAPQFYPDAAPHRPG